MKPIFKSKKLNGLTKEEFDEQAKKAKLSYASSCVSKETRSKAGKLGSIQGTKNLRKLTSDPEHQSKAAAAAGRAHVKSGWIKKLSKIGADAAKDKFSILRSNKLQIIFDAMEADVKYTTSELKKLVNEAKTRGILTCPEASDFLIRECKGQGATATYKRTI